MDFVWTYIKGPSYFNKGGLFNELEYSIKSVKKNYQGESRCFVVGDDPNLPYAIHLPIEQVRTHWTGRPNIVDQAKKFKLILDEDRIDDEFILMYDDIYLLQPMGYEDLTVTYAMDRVEDVEKYWRTRKGSRPYRSLWLETYRRIREFRSDLYDWETHLPRHIIKENLRTIVDWYDLEGPPRKTDSGWVPLLSTALYAAHFAEHTVLMNDTVQYDLIQWPPKIPLDEGFKRKFMNLTDQAITSKFIKRMEHEFGESVSVKPPYGRR